MGFGFRPMDPSSTGTCPDNELPLRFSHKRLVQFPRWAGMLLLKLLCANISHKSHWRFPRLDGIEPWKVLEERSRA